jgi:hypothetical protein
MRTTIVALLALALSAPLLAQTAPEPAGDALLRVLVEEIRALRTSLQKTSAYELRGRLLVDRARLHQENIRELTREVEGMSEAMRSSENVDFAFDAETEMAARTSTMTNPDDRRRLEEQMKAQMEKRREMHARYLEQNRLRLQRLESRLMEERDKLAAIEGELADIQRELGAATR